MGQCSPDPLRLAIALVPLGAYFLLLALINMRRRPFVTTGGSDLAALGGALTEMMVVGPIELFRPEAGVSGGKATGYNFMGFLSEAFSQEVRGPCRLHSCRIPFP